MSFDWDSIKVVNNPDLKEIEALFTPISSLGGIESPNEDGSPGGGSGGGGDGGGSEDGGGGGQPVIVDCTPPSLPSKCRQRCDAYQDYVSVPGMTMGTQAEMDALYGTGALDLNGFRFINRLNYRVNQGDGLLDLPTYDTVEFTAIEPGNTDSTPCAPDLLHLRTRGGLDNARLSCLSVEEMSAAQYQGNYTDDFTMRDPLDRSQTYSWRALINTLADTGLCRLMNNDIPIYTDVSQQGRAGDYWDLSWDKTAGTVTVASYIAGSPFSTVNVSEVTVPFVGDLLDIDLSFTMKSYRTVVTNGDVREDYSRVNGTLNGQPIDLVAEATQDVSIYQLFHGQFGNPEHGMVFPIESPGLFNIYAISRVSADLDDVVEAIKRSTPGFIATDPDCLAVENWVKPEGCPDCPDIPCYCGDFTLDPLNCEPEGYKITGGFYAERVSADANGVFPNYNGTNGRLELFKDGVVVPFALDSLMMNEAFYNNNLYYLLGLRDTQGFNYALGHEPYNMVRGSTTPISSSQTFEAAALVGLVDDQNVASPAVLSAPDNTSGTPGLDPHAGRVRLEGSGRVRDQFGNSPVSQSIGLTNLARMERRSGDTVAYYSWTKANGATWTDVTLPASVLNPADKFVWFSFKSVVQWEELGSTVPNWTELDTNPAYSGYRYRNLVTYYVNGYEIATVATQTSNAGYYPNDDWAYYKTAQDPTGKVFTLTYQTEGVPDNASVVHMPITSPTDSTELVMAWQDVGPGAANLPNTPLGKNLSRINDNWVAPADCAAIVIPEGCSQNLCPEEGDCPCSCQGQSYDPLGCNASVITGGLYAETDDATRVDGVFPNYNGSFGRVDSYQNGVGTNAGWQEHYVEMPNNNTYRIMSGNEIQTLGATDFNWEGLTGFNRTETYEFCALVGKIDSQTAGSRTLLDFTANPNANSEQQRVELNINPNYRPTDNSAFLTGFDIFCYMARENGNQVSYWTRNEFGGNDKHTVTLPESVMRAGELFTWFSAKVTHTFAEIGPADEGYAIGITNPNYTIYTVLATCDYFVNGFPIATGVPINRKSGYNPDDLENVVAALTPGGVKPEGLRWCSNNTPLLSNGTIPTVRAKNPSFSNGNDELAIAFVDIGPGASQIPATEQGRNLKRIDPTYTNYEDCNNCGDAI